MNAPPHKILVAFNLQGWDLSSITIGLINRTFLAQRGDERLILQRINPIFAPEVNEDISAVTTHLAESGMETPRLVQTVHNQVCFTDDQGGVWRALTHIEGETIQRVDSMERATEAGALLGRFHGALRGLGHEFIHKRPGVHDTRAHLMNLEQALADHPEHPALAKATPVGLEILNQAKELPHLPDLPPRAVHGDPKISNIIFAADGRARCLVDLDTLGRMPLHLELGDALRSWCNPAGEENPGQLELTLVRATLSGYASAAPTPEPEELAALPCSPGLIALELAARFCADALQERYFGWDAQRFPSASAHNLCRAQSQLALAKSALAALPDINIMVESLWS